MLRGKLGPGRAKRLVIPEALAYFVLNIGVSKRKNLKANLAFF
jgi:hypothetical protein